MERAEGVLPAGGELAHQLFVAEKTRVRVRWIGRPHRRHLPEFCRGTSQGKTGAGPVPEPKDPVARDDSPVISYLALILSVEEKSMTMPISSVRSRISHSPRPSVPSPQLPSSRKALWQSMQSFWNF